MGASDRNRFFNAVALTDCVCLTLSKADYDYVVNSSERKIFNDKMHFIKSIPEFQGISLPRSKLFYLC
jgi:hypothetical protein